MAADPGGYGKHDEGKTNKDKGKGLDDWYGNDSYGYSAGMVAAAVSAAVKAGATAVQLDAVTAAAIWAARGGCHVPRRRAWTQATMRSPRRT